MSLTRREVCLVLPGLFPVAAGLNALAEQDNSLPSGAFSFDQLPVQVQNGAQIRHILKGKLATGEPLEAHETTLPPGGSPHPPHHHLHSEMFLIREGTLELTINGKHYRLEPGSLGFVHSNEEHGVKNVGANAATYFIVAIGPGADTQP
jgi:quercetin dioxygenase-like cupin family protein